MTKYKIVERNDGKFNLYKKCHWFCAWDDIGLVAPILAYVLVKGHREDEIYYAEKRKSHLSKPKGIVKYL